MADTSQRIRDGIIETAAALGMAPSDLATIISYETGGTFDPSKAGPTTQWGQHRGLIQFGEPQAQQYGVNWNDPIGSQLGANGAIARYFKSNGWQPGMGLMQAYSIVNAGGPNRFNASDANNGGAPGTVADKVNSQMSGHQRNAVQLLGGDYAVAAAAPQPGFTAEQISAAFAKARQPEQVTVQQEQQPITQAPMQPRQGYQNQNDILAQHMQALQSLQQKRRGLLEWV